MNYVWNELLSILPQWMRSSVDKYQNRQLQEIRLRLGHFPELVTGLGCVFLERDIETDDLNYIINIASSYSPWAATTISYGFLTAPGGHRIGICGEAILHEDKMQGIRRVSSLCIRVAKDIVGISDAVSKVKGSVLIIGSPGSGKTTFLRDLIRQRSRLTGEHIGVVDERKEIFPVGKDGYCFDPGEKTDVLSGCKKGQGIHRLLRCMGPQVIAMDEITEEEDCNALISAAWCGVNLIATAHANGMDELVSRKIYQPILKTGLFHNIVVLRSDKSWTLERNHV